MSIRIDLSEARETLDIALDIARSDIDLPDLWIDFSRYVFSMSAKTYTPALGTVLLAKATENSVDVLSIKASGKRSYSLRTLGHQVLVPAAHESHFSIRTTGREPLNNQPFFRFNRMDEFERVREPEQVKRFVDGVKKAENLTESDALVALAAFLRVALEVASADEKIIAEDNRTSLQVLLISVRQFLKPNSVERPKRLQALAAACLDLIFDDVRSRKINDPSRDFPGDVQSYDEDIPLLSMEVRGKPVPASELEAFIESCVQEEIYRCVLFVDWHTHKPLKLTTLSSPSLDTGRVLLSVYESAEVLAREALSWSPLELSDSIFSLIENVLIRLREIEVTQDSLSEWVSYFKN